LGPECRSPNTNPNALKSTYLKQTNYYGTGMRAFTDHVPYQSRNIAILFLVPTTSNNKL